MNSFAILKTRKLNVNIFSFNLFRSNFPILLTNQNIFEKNIDIQKISEKIEKTYKVNFNRFCKENPKYNNAPHNSLSHYAIFTIISIIVQNDN